VSPVEASLEAGTHVLELRRDGYKPARTSAVVFAGQRKEVAVPLESEPGIFSRWWFWTGVGLLAAGGVALGIALTTEKDPASGTVPPGVVVGGLEAGGFRF
jgi:hypothetical protein